MKSFEKDERGIRQFEECDLPAFERWKQLHLGPLIAEFHEIEQEIEKEETLLRFAVERQRATGGTLRNAYHHIQDRIRREQNRTDNPPDDDSNEEDNDDGPAGFDDYARPDREEEFDDDFLRKIFASFFGLDPDEMFYHKKENAALESELRSRYRKLSRMLHPDIADTAFPDRSRLWNETQDAYRQKDIEKLDEILARVELATIGVEKIEQVGKLIALIEHFRTGAQAIRGIVRRARKHPAWKFTAMSEVAQRYLLNKMKADLVKQTSLSRGRLAELLAFRNREMEPRKPRPRRPVPDDPNQLTFAF